jgi:excisionase family DNA binding protein
MTVAEIAAWLRLSKRAVYGYIAAGRIPAVRVGSRNLRVDLDELRRALPRA